MLIISRHPIASFFCLAWLFSWVFMIPLGLSKHGFIPTWPYWLHYLSAYGPLLAALVVTGATTGSSGIAAWWNRINRWRAGPWTWIITLSPLLALLGAVLVNRAINKGWLDLSTLGNLNFLPGIGWWAILLWLFNSGLGEEAGWRGFALPELLKRHSPRITSLFIAGGWTLWHIPAFFYLPSYTHFSIGMGVGFFLGVLSGAYLLTWVFLNGRGSMLLPIIWHGLFNFTTAPPSSGKFIAPVVSTVVMMIGMITIFLLNKPTPKNITVDHS